MSRRWSAWASSIAVGMIVTGVAFCCILIDRGPIIGDLSAQLPAGLTKYPWAIVAAGMVLLGCAAFYRVRASSRFGCRIAGFVVAATVVAVAAGLIAHFLMPIRLSQPPNTALGTAAAAAATIMVCASLVAAIGVVASVGIIARGAMGTLRSWAWHRMRGVSLPRILLPYKFFQRSGADAGMQ